MKLALFIQNHAPVISAAGQSIQVIYFEREGDQDEGAVLISTLVKAADATMTVCATRRCSRVRSL